MNNNNKYNNRNLLLAIIVIFLGVIVIAGSFAYYSWASGNVKKNILFNTSKALSEYIVYDEGESKFVGDFKIGNSYSDGIHTTISINKTSEAENVDLFATIYLKVNSIGESITNSMAVKWVLVDGDETSTNVISSGNFYGVEANEQFALKNFIPVTTTLKKYTVWIWLDQSENIPSSITGETLDTLVYTQVDQIQVMEKEIFEITKINANYQFINATVINNKNQIVKYNVTKTNTTPSVFNDVGDEYVYCNASGDACNLENYIVNDGTGTYYVWFKDSSENVISKEVNVSNIDATGPVCTFDMFNPSSIKGNETSQINLTCVDEIGIKNSNIDISDISISNNSLLEVNSVIKSAVNNGYKYTIEVKALSLTDNGEVTLTLPANIIQNKANLGNTISTSGNISVLNTISISFNANGGSGGQSASVEATFGSSMPEISTTMPTKAGYTFMGWYDNADYTKGTQYYTASGTSARNFDKTTPMTLYAGWIDDNAPVFSSVTVSNTYDIKNYVKFTAIDEGAGIVGYNITTSTTAPTTWIPVVNGVEDATETKYAYDASWARVFHHNAHYGTVLYSDSTEAKSSNTVDKYSVLGNLENYRNTDGKFEFLLEYPGVSGYNRWIQTDNPATVTVANGTGDETVAGYSAVNVSWTGYYWGGLALSTSSATFIDGGIGHSSWYFAIGSYSAYKGGIPGPNSSMVSHVNLWTRIDDKPAITTNTLTRTIGDISSNGTYYIWVKDSLGNVSYESINISKVDTTAPSLDISSLSATTVGLNYSDNVGVTKYYFGTSNPANTNVTWTSITSSTSGSLTKTISSTGTYYFAVQDAAGNRTIIDKKIYKVTLSGDTNTSVSLSTVYGIADSEITVDSNYSLHASNDIATITNSNNYLPFGWIESSGVTDFTKSYTVDSGINDNGSIIYGPYATLTAGKYVAIFTGTNLNDSTLVYDIKSGGGSNDIPYLNLAKTSTSAYVYFELESDTSLVETRIWYSSTSITVSGLKIHKVIDVNDSLSLSGNLDLKALSLFLNYASYDNNDNYLGMSNNLSTAYSKIKSNSGTIKVLNDVTDESIVTIKKDIVLNTNGKTITLLTNYILINSGTLSLPNSGTITKSSSDNLIRISGPNSTLNIPSGSKIELSHTNDSSWSIINDGGTAILNGGTISAKNVNIYNVNGNLTVDGASLSGNSHVIASTCNSNSKTNSITVNSGTINSTGGIGILVDSSVSGCSSTTVINGGTISGNSAIQNYSKESGAISTVTVNGGILTGKTNDGIINYGSESAVTNIGSPSTSIPSTTNPSVTGSSLGIWNHTNGVWNFYSGVLKGSNTGYSNAFSEAPSAKNANYNIVTSISGNQRTTFLSSSTLDFANQSKSISWSSSSQTLSISSAVNGSGNYTYSEVSEKNASGTSTSYFTISGTTITAAANTAPGVYSYTVKATDNSSGLTKNAVITITVNNVDNFTVSASLSGTNLICSVSGTYSPVSNYYFTKCDSNGCDPYTSGTSTSMNISLANAGTNKPYYCKAKLIHTNGEVSTEKSSSAVYLKFEVKDSSILCSASSNNTSYPLVYTGECTVSSSGQVSFKTIGANTLYVNTSGIYADIFAVGGGGGGSSSHSGKCTAGSGGGGGKTSMTAAYLLTGSSYTITVGGGGAGGTSGGAGSAGGTSKFGSVISAAGGGGAAAPTDSISGAAGSGGSGGGRGGRNANGSAAGGAGGSYGANGSSNGTDAGGSGQGTTTCAFHKGTTSSCTSGYSAFGGGGGGGVGYNKTFGSAPGTGGAGGGGAGGYKLNVSPYSYVGATNGADNYGGGGGGGGTFIDKYGQCASYPGGAGGSGIVMMMATDTSLPFSYTGNYETVKNTGSVWEVKLLSNGTFKVTSNTSVDIFCVGGGGGGSSSPAMAVGGAGGGGGYTKTVSGTTLTAGTGYSVTIGAGGAGGKANLSNSTASAGSAGAASKFASLLTANGGSGGVLPTDVGAVGGAGGSGGGAGGRNWSSSNNGGAGGSYGNNGSSNASSTAAGGTGQGSTTCAFGKGTTSSCNSGYKVYAAGGGGGAGYQTANYGAGGTGGGGLGGYVNSSFQYVAATSGTINTGSGGGGGGDWLKNGADGGSGICIVRTHSTS